MSQPKNTATGRRAFGLAAFGALAAPAIVTLGAKPAAAQDTTAFSLIEGAASVSLFAGAMKTHGLDAEFKAPGNFGFFIPANHGVERVSAAVVARFQRDKDFARQLLLNHITDFRGMINAFPGANTSGGSGDTVRTQAGNSYTLWTGAALPRIGGNPIIYMNHRVSNGFVHVIDGVLLP